MSADENIRLDTWKGDWGLPSIDRNCLQVLVSNRNLARLGNVSERLKIYKIKMDMSDRSEILSGLCEILWC